VPLPAPRLGRRLFIAGLGIGQIASWGTLYYSFPLIAERMGEDLGLSKPEVRWALRQRAFWGLLIAFTVYYATFSGLSFHLYSLLLERGFGTATVVAVLVLLGPSQVAGRIAVWGIAERASVRTIGRVVVLAFPIALLLLLLPATFASLAAFAILYGAANGILTIVRGIAVPEMLTREAYGALNSVLAVPTAIAKAIAPLGIAMLWAAAGSYDVVLVGVLASSTLVVAGFWFAAAQTDPKTRPDAIQG
jgi:predicted MFS family arabinose efflux permease